MSKVKINDLPDSRRAPLVCVLAISAAAFMLAAPVRGDVITLNYVSAATGEDYGPQDGIFDAFTAPNPDFSLINNNGFTSLRTAFEFNLSGLPAGATIDSAYLTMAVGTLEGLRTIEVHGYAGTGTVQLADFAISRLLASANVVGGTGGQTVIDVTSFVADLVANGKNFAGFNVRENPPNSSNLLVIIVDLRTGFGPVLSIHFSITQTIDIDIKPGTIPNSVNTTSGGRIPVAILSSPTFYAPSEVDTTSLTFGRTGDETSLAFCNSIPEDVNSDGLLDLVCHFETDATAFRMGDTQGVLKGKTPRGVPIRGTDSVRVVR